MNAAIACIWSCLGKKAEAQRWWPWGKFPGGSPDDLAVAGALLAMEVDAPILNGGRTWVTSGRPSVSGH